MSDDESGLSDAARYYIDQARAALASARANARSETDQPDAACAAGTEEQR